VLDPDLLVVVPDENAEVLEAIDPVVLDADPVVVVPDETDPVLVEEEDVGTFAGGTAYSAVFT